MKYRNLTAAMILIMTMTMPTAQAVMDSATPAARMPDHAVTTDAPIAGHGLLLAAGGGMMGGGTMGGGMMGGSGGGTMNDSGGNAQPMNDGMSHDSSNTNTAASGSDTGPIRLKDGSMLYTNDAGNMRMIDNHGNRMEMKDGETMETEDGRVIMMKNHILWEKMRRGTLNPKFP